MVEMLTAVASWATPTTLFLLLNLVIGVIAVTSAFASPKKNHHQQQQQLQQQQPVAHLGGGGGESPGNRLTRSPSLFSRVTSFNFPASPLSFGSSSAPATPSGYDYAAYHSQHQLTRSETFNDDAEPPQHHLVSSYADGSGDGSPYTPEPSSSRSRVVLPSMTSTLTPSPQKKPPAVVPSTTPSSMSRSPSFLARMASFNFSFPRSEHSPSAAAAVYRPEAEQKPAEHFERTESEPIRMKRLDADEMLRKTASDMVVEADAANAEEEEEEEEEKTVTLAATAGVTSRDNNNNDGNNYNNKKTGKKKKKAKKVASKETVRFRGGNEKEEELVDAKADDFINRFRQQLRMQKLDSIIRRTETT